jgi:hypothetical protein
VTHVRISPFPPFALRPFPPSSQQPDQTSMTRLTSTSRMLFPLPHEFSPRQSRPIRRARWVRVRPGTPNERTVELGVVVDRFDGVGHEGREEGIRGEEWVDGSERG